MPQQQEQIEKLTIKQFAAKLRDKMPDLPSDVSDEELTRKVFERRPDLMEMVQTQEPRFSPEHPPQGSATGRFIQGMGAQPGEAIKGFFKGGGNPTLADKSGSGLKGKVPPMPAPLPAGTSLMDDLGNMGKSMIDIPNIQKDIDKGDTAHAMGRSLTQGIYAASAVKGKLPAGDAAPASSSALKDMEAIGEATGKDAMLAVAKTISKPQMAKLDASIAEISKAMENEYISTKSLSAGIAYAKKVIEKVSKAPGAQVKDVSAAKEAVARLGAKMKANPNNIPWNDARDAMKELKSARKSLGVSAAGKSIDEVVAGLEKEIKDTAKATGQGEAYDKWVKDYHSISNWQRGYARVLNKQTQVQRESMLTAKDGVSVGIPKTNLKVRFGKARADKIAETHKGMVTKAHKGLEELDKRIGQPVKPSAPKPKEMPSLGIKITQVPPPEGV